MKLSKWQKNNIKKICISDLINIKSVLAKVNKVEYYPNFELICKDKGVIDALIDSQNFYIEKQGNIMGFFKPSYTCPKYIAISNRLYKY